MRPRPTAGVRVMALDIDPRTASAEFAMRRVGFHTGRIRRRGQAARAGLSAPAHYCPRAVRLGAAASVRSISERRIACAPARAVG